MPTLLSSKCTISPTRFLGNFVNFCWVTWQFLLGHVTHTSLFCLLISWAYIMMIFPMAECIAEYFSWLVSMAEYLSRFVSGQWRGDRKYLRYILLAKSRRTVILWLYHIRWWIVNILPYIRYNYRVTSHVVFASKVKYTPHRIVV